MSDMKLPLSRRHLDIAIERLASRFAEAVDWANDLIDKISRA